MEDNMRGQLIEILEVIDSLAVELEGPIRWAWSSFTVESSPRHEKRRAPRPWRGHPRPGLN